MTDYNWKDEKTKLLRMLRNSKTLKEKNGWSREAGAGFVKDDLDSVELGPDKTITVKSEAFTVTGKTGDFNLRETEEMISFLEMKTHLAEHKKSLLDEWDLIKKYEKEIPESEQNKEDYERWKDKKEREELKEYIAKTSKCPYCPKTFEGSLKERDDKRINHIKEEHPEERPFEIGVD